MNAEEAREKSLKVQQEEIVWIKTLIEGETNRGNMYIDDVHKLYDCTLIWLKDNGYTVKMKGNSEFPFYRISW